MQEKIIKKTIVIKEIFEKYVSNIIIIIQKNNSIKTKNKQHTITTHHKLSFETIKTKTL